MLRVFNLFVLILFSLVLEAKPDRVTATETIERRLPFKPGAELQLENKYGHIVVYTWSKDSILINFTKTAEAKNHEVAEQLLESVDMDVLTGSKYVRVTTLFAQTKGWLGGIFQKMMEESRQLLGGQKLEVSYEIYIPANRDLTIQNRFGNVILPEVEGRLRVDLSHGDIRVPWATGRTDLSLSYGTFRSDYLEQASLNLSFMTADITAGNSVQLESKSSDVHIGKIVLLDIQDAFSGSINIREVDRMMGRSTFTDVRAEKVNQEATFKSKFGTFTITSLAEKFSTLNLECSGTDYYLGVAPKSSFSLIVASEKAKGLSLPKDRVDLVKDEMIGESRYVEATFSGGHATRSIRIDAKNSDITLSYVP